MAEVDGHRPRLGLIDLSANKLSPSHWHSHLMWSPTRTLWVGIVLSVWIMLSFHTAVAQSGAGDYLPPQIIIDSPLDGSVLTRSVSEESRSIDPYEPASINVMGHVVWADGQPRSIEQAQFWVDGALEGQTSQNPTGDLRFHWDLSQYSEAGAWPARLQVLVSDEYGFESVSAPVIVVIQVSQGVLPGQTGGQATACQGLGPAAAWICRMTQPMGGTTVLLLVVALFGLVSGVVLAGWMTTRRISQHAGYTASNGSRPARETVTRLSNPLDAEVSAYLEVLQGDENLVGKYIPIYVDTATPAGRSVQQAEIVFDMNNERSVVSRLHCEFWEEGGIVRVRDMGSTQGTYVNGLRILTNGDGQMLLDGDRIELGPAERGGIVLRYRLPALEMSRQEFSQ